MGIKVFLGGYVLWNCYVFIAMGRDKRRAKRHQWRISEARLIFMGAALGGIGLYAGMKIFHHKTNHAKFTVGAPLLILVNLLMIGLFYYIGNFKLDLF